MFSRPTVIIVGAGASYELGLPVGSDLKQTISSLLNITFPDGWNQTTGDHQIKDLVRARSQDRGERDWNPILHKCWLLRDALPGSLSIDNLMDAHRSDEDIAFIGKLAITKAILAAERRSKLFREQGQRELTFSDLDGTWLIPFFQIASEGVAKEDAPKMFENVTFIVFNYDRCIERFLPIALKLYYNLSDQDAAAIASSVKIVHPYGQVGAISRPSRLELVPFGSDRYDLARVAQGIRTFSEGLHDPDQQTSITTAIEDASQLVFLGFAFHPLNMGLLATPSITSVRKIFATTIGMSEAAVRSVKASLFTAFGKLQATPSTMKQLLELEELNLEAKEAYVFLAEHLRGIAETALPRSSTDATAQAA